MAELYRLRPRFVPESALSRPLPPRGAGEEDFRLDTRPRIQNGPLPPCVAGERDSKTADENAELNARPTSKRKNLIHLPGKPAGVFSDLVVRLAIESDSPAG